MDGEQQKYLIQISPPADIIPEVVRSIIIAQNITDAGILFDDSFGKCKNIRRSHKDEKSVSKISFSILVMDHKYKSLLQNIPTRHIIAQIEDARSIQRQLTRFRDLDIVNYFVLGRLSTVKTLLDNANMNKFFGRKFAWHVITQVPQFFQPIMKFYLIKENITKTMLFNVLKIYLLRIKVH